VLSQSGATGNSGIIQIYRTILKTEGLAGLFASNGANLVRIFPSKGVVFTANDVYKQRLGRLLNSDDLQSRKFAVSFLAGGFSGMTASAVTYPLDLIRGRIGGTSSSGTKIIMFNFLNEYA